MARAKTEPVGMPRAIAALIYWVFNFVVEMLLGAAEKKLDYYHD